MAHREEDLRGGGPAPRGVVGLTGAECSVARLYGCPPNWASFDYVGRGERALGGQIKCGLHLTRLGGFGFHTDHTFHQTQLKCCSNLKLLNSLYIMQRSHPAADIKARQTDFEQSHRSGGNIKSTTERSGRHLSRKIRPRYCGSKIQAQLRDLKDPAEMERHKANWLPNGTVSIRSFARPRPTCSGEGDIRNNQKRRELRIATCVAVPHVNQCRGRHVQYPRRGIERIQNAPHQVHDHHMDGLHSYSTFIQSALQYCLTFTHSCTHSNTYGGVNHASRQPACREQSG